MSRLIFDQFLPDDDDDGFGVLCSTVVVVEASFCSTTANEKKNSDNYHVNTVQLSSHMCAKIVMRQAY